MKNYIILFLTAILLTGCSLIMEYPDDPVPVEENDEFVNLSFNIVLPVAVESRADNYHDETGSENPALEDKIYADDFIFFVYAGTVSTAESDLAFIAKVNGDTPATDPDVSISGGVGSYIVRISIAKKDFLEAVGNDTENVVFRVVAFANTKKVHNNIQAVDYATFGKLIATATEWNFSILRYVYQGTGGMQLTPRIPMYGTTRFVVTRNRLDKSTMADPIWGENLYLLRSLAKVKVIDNITGRDDKGLPRVEVVTFHGLPNAYMLPYNAASYTNGYQVETARPYTIIHDTMELGLLPSSQNVAGNPGNLWTGYITEQATADCKITIRVTYETDADGNPAVYQDFDVSMAGYNGHSFSETFGEYILRNHIYTLSVTGVSSSTMTFNVAVKDWKKIEYEYEY